MVRPAFVIALAGKDCSGRELLVAIRMKGQTSGQRLKEIAVSLRLD